MTQISDERLADLIADHSAISMAGAMRKTVERHADTATALRELQAARAVMNCYCPRCEGRYWVEHQCPVS